jgi:hypothetical protein
MNTREDPGQDPVEERLGHYALSAPPPGLRDRVLTAAANKPGVPRSELALRWALTALVLTFVWASWMERCTGEEMARIARQAPEPPVVVLEEQTVMERNENFLVTALLETRRRLPLEPGVRSTHMRISPSSILVLPKGDPA